MLNGLRTAYDHIRLKRHFSILARANNFTFPFAPTLEDCVVCKEIFQTRTYALAFPSFSKAVIVDIGAHKGFFTLFAGRNTLPESRILSFEPSPENFMVLQKVVAANNLKNVACIQKGIAGKSGKVSLYAGSSTNNSIVKDYSQVYAESANHPTATIEVITIEDILTDNNFEKIDFMKIDCEGAEYESLYNASKSVLSAIDVISLEYHDLKRADCTGLSLYKFLKSQGYNILSFTVDEAFSNVTSGKLVAARL